MTKNGITQGSGVKKALAVSVTAALALGGVAVGASSATAVPVGNHQKTILASDLGLETEAGYPTNPLFEGQSTYDTSNLSVDGDNLVLAPNTQVLHAYPADERPSDLEGVIEDGLGFDATGGGTSAFFQIPLTYGANKFVTLRPAAGTPTTGENDVALSDVWTSSKPVAGVAETAPLSDFVDAIDGAGNVAVFGFGVFSDAATVKLDELTGGGVDYSFASDTTVPEATSTIRVPVSTIGTETTSYPDTALFFGASDYENTGGNGVMDGEFALNENTQLLHGFALADRPSNLKSFVTDGLSWTQGGTGASGAFFQIPVSYQGGFTTLRPAALTAGTNTAQLGDQWVSSKDVGVGTDGKTGTLAQLVDAIDNKGNVAVLGYGVFAQGATTVSALQAGTDEYTFVGDVTAPIVAPIKVQTADIGKEIDGYPANAIFEGASSYEDTGITGVTAGALGLKPNTQLLHGYAADDRPTDLAAFINSGVAVDQNGSGASGAFFQIPLTFGSTNKFVTLRPAAPLTSGAHTAQWTDQWVSSKDIGVGTDGKTSSLVDIVNTIEAAGNVSIFGYGVFSQDASTVTSIQVGAQQYIFAADPTLSFNSLTIVGTPTVGVPLSVAIDLDHDNATYTYSWANNGTAIAGAKQSTYTPTASDLGDRLTVKVKAARSGFVSVVATSAKSAVVAAGTLEVSAPTVTGDPSVGKLVTATYGKSDGTTAYRWYRDGVAISTGTAYRYRLVAADAGKDISVQIRVTEPGYSTVTIRSDSVEAQLGTLVVGTPKISGTAKVGSTLTAKPGTWTAGTSLKYTWYVDDTLYKVTTAGSLKLGSGAKGHHVTVKVSGHLSGYTAVFSPLSAPTAVVK
jgi:hypothetical protein